LTPPILGAKPAYQPVRLNAILMVRVSILNSSFMAYFRQCTLTKKNTNQVAWIPENFAIKGIFLKIVDENGWQVSEVGNRQDGAVLQAHEREYMNHRKVTDI